MNPLLVSAAQAGMRLDQLVAKHLGLSRRLARLLISAGRVRVGQKTCRILTRTVGEGARITIEAEPGAPEPPSTVAPGPKHHAPPDILHEDRWLIVINKPAGLLSEEDRFGGPSVMPWLSKFLRARKQPDALWLVHRLDAGTSGVLLLARQRSMAEALSQIFREREARKEYSALVAGAITQDTLTLDGPIARVRGTRHGVHPEGKPALTHVHVLARHQQVALVRAEPHTGRTHQIRVHLSHAGLPLLGDRLYGGPGYARGGTPEHTLVVPRPMLHARALHLVHPGTHQPLSVRAPYAEDFVALTRSLHLEIPHDA